MIGVVNHISTIIESDRIDNTTCFPEFCCCPSHDLSIGTNVGQGLVLQRLKCRLNGGMAGNW